MVCYFGNKYRFMYLLHVKPQMQDCNKLHYSVQKVQLLWVERHTRSILVFPVILSKCTTISFGRIIDYLENANSVNQLKIIFNSYKMMSYFGNFIHY